MFSHDSRRTDGQWGHCKSNAEIATKDQRSGLLWTVMNAAACQINSVEFNSEHFPNLAGLLINYIGIPSQWHAVPLSTKSGVHLQCHIQRNSLQLSVGMIVSLFRLRGRFGPSCTRDGEREPRHSKGEPIQEARIVSTIRMVALQSAALEKTAISSMLRTYDRLGDGAPVGRTCL